MKKILLVILLSIFMNQSANAGRFVSGYYRKSGTYVAPSYRTRANSTKWDNYSTKGNSNPYSGRKGYKSPWKY